MQVLAGGLAATAVGVASPAQAAADYRVRVTCNVPDSQPERQLAEHRCMNYLPDGTQTYNVRVRDGNGDPVVGVWVKWTDNDKDDAYFRYRQNPCKTGPRGRCSAELVDENPKDGEKITVTATVGGVSDHGYLTFRRK